MIVACECGAKLKIDDAKAAGRTFRVRCPRCGNLIPVHGGIAVDQRKPQSRPVPTPSPTGPLVLVAHDSDVVRYHVGDVLTQAGFRIEYAADGFEALRKTTDLAPKAIVLDVGIPGIYGFQLCEKLKNDAVTKQVRIVLLSSVYDKRRYKRTPENLYGADDYIEKHHIQDNLVEKLRRLLDARQPQPAAAPQKQSHVHQLPEMARPPAREFESSLLRTEAATTDAGMVPRAAEPFRAKSESAEATALFPETLCLDSSIFQKEECDIPRVEETDPEAVEKAQRFARIIVSDIALYNQETVIDGIRNGTFFELLKNDIDEGRELYERRVPPAVKAKKDYYQEAFDNFISAAQKKNVR